MPQPESLAKENAAKEVSPALTPVEDEPKHQDNPETTTTENFPAAAGDKDKRRGSVFNFQRSRCLGVGFGQKGKENE